MLSEVGVINFFAGIVLGIVFHRSDFCFAAIFRDAFLFRQTFMAKILYLQITVTMALFLVGLKTGIITNYPPSNLAAASVGSLLGGAVFGTGMVLAGGCVIGTLYKMGAGSIGSLLAFFGLLSGSALFAEIYPAWNASAQNIAISKAVLLTQLIRGNFFVYIVVVAAFIPVIFWGLAGKLSQKAYAEGYLRPWKAAVSISVLNLIVYIASGVPMAVSTGYAKIAGFLEKLWVPGHFETLTFFRKISFTVTNPATGNISAGGPGPVFDHIFATENTLILGIVLGAFASALSLKEFRFQNLPPRRQGISALLGGILLAVGSRMAGGCNVKFLMSGLPLLSIQAFVFLIGLLPGVMAGNFVMKNWVLRLQGGYDVE